MLVDEIPLLILIAGHGGPGKVSFAPGSKSGPDGGNGGRGGDVYLKATSDLMALGRFISKTTLKAPNGVAGGHQRKFGKDGEPITLLMPIGTVLKDKLTGEEIELTAVDQEICIAKGGLGGRGNYEFRSSTNTTPEFAQPGLPGEEKQFEIKLKLIADFGLIGLPNAGKSSLLNELTQANPKIADYPFTTLEPNLGVYSGKILADIPGLIEGASSGKGLGIKFLKHIEKVTMLLHCIDCSSPDVLKDYQIIRKELQEYSPDLLKKKEIILLTKSDLVSSEQLTNLKNQFKTIHKKVYPISIHDWESVQKLSKLLLLK